LVTSVGVALKPTPLHVTAVIALIVAFGFTVTVTVNVAPAPQLTVDGVTVYVAVCVMLVGLLNVPVILDAPEPVVPPVNPPVTLGVPQL
jgi:hypothetical protein